MSNSQTIARNAGSAEPFAFARLRQEGIAISQELSGLGWTDYNHHDPGVTILEQICFALTDLIYRSRFDVTDYLCNEAGEINMSALGLHAPEDVFFSRPGTTLDYQKALVDMSADISEALVSSNSTLPGLYQVQVRRGPDSHAGLIDDDELVRETEANFHQLRNLCEDLDSSVTVVEEVECDLRAEISLKPDCHAAGVLAAIYHAAGEELAKAVAYEAYSAGLDEGQGLEDSFTGTFTANGLLADAVFDESEGERDRHLRESAILARIRDIEGVDYVASLQLVAGGVHGGQNRIPSHCNFRLAEPQRPSDLRGIRLSSSGRNLAFAFDDFLAQLENLRFASSNKTYKLEEDRILSAAPRGTHRDVARYQSLQNDFPVAYGINRFGVPEHYSPQRKAQALQLKSYLLLFEQIMANYLANLDSIRQLFSIEIREEATYRSGVLRADEISSLEQVYPANAEQVLDTILERIDDFIGRKSRLLDYLLGLYGEQFKQDQLRNLDCYHTPAELERHIILNKIRLLNRIKYASGDRAAAANINSPNYYADVSDESELFSGRHLQAVSGLQYRSSILLGFKYLAPRSLVREVFNHDVRIDSGDGNSEYIAEAARLFQNREQRDEEDQRYYRVVRRTASRIPVLRRGILSQQLLKQGVSADNYRYEEDELFLRLGAEAADSEDDDNWLSLLRSDDAGEAERSKRFLRRYLIHLSKECEGMHVLEHILLRPADFNELDQDARQRYANRVTVVFPAWTARCSDPQFRSLAADVVRENCPAHISPEIHWLDFSSMCEFEVLHRRWLDLRGSGDVEGRDKASRALIRFVELQKSRRSIFNRETSRFVELRESVLEQLDHFLKLLYHRRQELELSPRREDDAEQEYLTHVEAFEKQIAGFAVRIVEHMQLAPAERDASEDWEFYARQVSVVLPMLEVFRAGNDQQRYFHRVRDIVESSVLRAAENTVKLNFHWLVPADMKKFQAIHDRWLGACETGRGEAQCARELQDVLQQLQAFADITSDTRIWKSVLEDRP